MDVKILSFSGPSIYCKSASVVLELEEVFDSPYLASDTTSPLFLAISQFTERAKSEFIWPGGQSYPNDIKTRQFLNAWASLCVLANCDVFLYGGRQVSGHLSLFVSCTDNEIAKFAANYLIGSLNAGDSFNKPATKVVADFLHSVKPLAPSTATKCLVGVAWELGIPYWKVFGPHMVAYGAGKNSTIFNRQAPGDDGHHGTVISRDKHKSKLLFLKLGLPVTDSVIVNSKKVIDNRQITFFPCVVKPIDGSKGEGVYVNLRGYSDVARALEKAARTTNLPLMVERQILGDDVRLLVCRGELLVAVKRSRPFVVGDGVSSIAQLVEIENSKRKALSDEWNLIPQILMNEEAFDYWLTQGFTAEHVPKKDEKVNVRGTPHGTHGGAMIDVTNEVHPEIVSLAILASERVGAALCGLDYISSDHTKLPDETGGVFLEINTFPGLKPIELLNEQDQINCTKKILGKAAIPLDILVFVSESLSNLASLKKSVIGQRTAWYCDGRVGFGGFTSSVISPNASLSLAYERCILDSRADQLVFLLTSDEFRRYGLPCNRVRKAVVVHPEDVSAEIREVLRCSADTYEEICSQ